ncbi:MAG: hypothetical protein ABIO76_00610, partial [Ginsengibacter sp.]
MENLLSRKIFLQKTSLAGATLLLASLESWALQKDEKKIKVAVIGCGSVSNRYLPQLKSSLLIEVVSVCDIRYDRALEQAKQFD